VVEVPGERLFGDCRPISVPGAGDFEYYPNRDSLPYLEVYGVEDAETMFRGTLRYPGWCETWLALAGMGFVNDRPQDFRGLTYARFTAGVLGAAGDARKAFAARAGVAVSSPIVERAAWLGLFGDEPLPAAAGETAPMDVLAARLLEKCPYEKGERDMIVLHHDFALAFGSKREHVTSTLVAFGVPGGESAMARTVSLPAAIAARLILAGEIKLVGVHVPVMPEIYGPVLAELETLGIKCEERREAA
jgi:saccharopine dehydrogenase-like NADP-dependent oxidoreductase